MEPLRGATKDFSISYGAADLDRVFFTADPHLFHGEILRFANRSAPTVDQMHREFVRKWNETVPQDATVWILGDLSFDFNEQTASLIKKLNGRKILLLGNHDPAHPVALANNRQSLNTIAEIVQKYKAAGFGEVYLNGEIEVPEVGWVNVNHYPYASPQKLQEGHFWRIPDDGRPLLCGHVHQNWARKGLQINVGLDVRDFRPTSLRQIRNEIQVAKPHPPAHEKSDEPSELMPPPPAGAAPKVWHYYITQRSEGTKMENLVSGVVPLPRAEGDENIAYGSELSRANLEQSLGKAVVNLFPSIPKEGEPPLVEVVVKGNDFAAQQARFQLLMRTSPLLYQPLSPEAGKNVVAMGQPETPIGKARQLSVRVSTTPPATAVMLSNWLEKPSSGIALEGSSRKRYKPNSSAALAPFIKEIEVNLEKGRVTEIKVSFSPTTSPRLCTLLSSLMAMSLRGSTTTPPVTY